MRVLLDECVPRKLRRDLAEHHVRTAGEMGWDGKRNGELLSRAAEEFDVLLTVDRNMQNQQNIARFDIAVVVLLAFRNDIDLLRPLMPKVRVLLPTVQPRQLYLISNPE